MDFINKDFLRALDSLPTSVTTSLESSHPPIQPSASIATTHILPTIVSGDPPNDIAKKVNKVRMGRVPAGVVPGVTPPPDPERWLKKSERSITLQGKRRKGGGGGGATQGSVESTPAGGAPPSRNVGGSHSKGKKRK
jgi:signal recognition particle subunit SRP72